MTDIVVRLMKCSEDLAQSAGYGGYVRTLVEAAAEITRLRKVVRNQMDTARSKNKQIARRTR